MEVLRCNLIVNRSFMGIGGWVGGKGRLLLVDQSPLAYA